MYPIFGTPLRRLRRLFLGLPPQTPADSLSLASLARLAVCLGAPPQTPAGARGGEHVDAHGHPNAHDDGRVLVSRTGCYWVWVRASGSSKVTGPPGGENVQWLA